MLYNIIQLHIYIYTVYIYTHIYVYNIISLSVLPWENHGKSPHLIQDLFAPRFGWGALIGAHLFQGLHRPDAVANGATGGVAFNGKPWKIYGKPMENPRFHGKIYGLHSGKLTSLDSALSCLRKLGKVAKERWFMVDITITIVHGVIWKPRVIHLPSGND